MAIDRLRQRILITGAGRRQVAKGFYALAAALLNARGHAGSTPAGDAPQARP